ncbi:BTB/POZ domain-containing protein At1g04390 isoform X2 [Cajanus cajan]|uniref:BTB/POZ domain-containing protein At1g04390 isoform X2 n=1 Tax=Cajanus cajan TaxID=3821 RepID=UPI00098DA16E|nr:BTB/POZ domain-containing protein At1g04390 isoform X2 [Cajanus cajan]XP_020233391.1 BTB/POZ domain-containing protein At1g04390 isoform X2 [Cajanus cajan]XP_020233392.1 BTB/POZ domain-containing protein At1g04390 isoform X2 [Cajanus cajan]
MKSGRESDRSFSSHMQTLHRRLLHALNLGTRHFDEKTNKWKWQCANIEVQKNVLRSISAILDSSSGDARAARHAIVKESVADILGALLWILQCKSEALLTMASNVAVKLVSVLPNTLLQPHILDLVYCLSSLLSSHQVEVAIPCATALNLVISNLSATSEKEVMEALKETETSIRIVGNIKDFAEGAKKIEYFEDMTLLLSTILWRWPPSRFPVFNDVILMKGLANMHTRTDGSIKLVLLKLYTSLALCDSVARKLIEDGEIFPQMFVQAMGKSNPHVVQIEGFRLAQCLLRSQENCLKVVGLCGEALVDAIIRGMRETGLSSKKIGNNHGFLSVEACQLALITRWAGDHHINFWKKGIDKVLLNLLIGNIQDQLSEPVLSMEKQITMAKEGLKANYNFGLRSYVWDILGWLTIHCGENLNPYTHGNELCINLLITCACLSFVDTLEKWCRICQKDIDNHFQSEPVSRAVLMMIHSPCNTISSHTRFLLSDLLKVKGVPCFKSLIHTLDYTSSLESYGSFDKLQLVINLIGLLCLSSLPQYQRCLVESKGIKAIVLLVKRCLCNDIHVERHTAGLERSCCCFGEEDWEGSNVLLFYSLLGLTEILHQCDLLRDDPQQFSREVTNIRAQLVSKLNEICSNNSFSPGVRWYVSYILTYFGCYGFPNKLAKRIGKSLNKEEYSDMKLVVANGDCMSVHIVILAVRCPSLLPPQLLPSRKSTEAVTDKFVGETMREVRLSSHVDYEALVLLLEYVYLGCLHAAEETVKKLKILAKRCNLQPLLQMLNRQHPKWGTPFPSYNLTSALGSAGSCFSDVMLVAKSTELVGWTCNICSDKVPHMHVHKVILQAGCDYLQGLFRSGMQERQLKDLR